MSWPSNNANGGPANSKKYPGSGGGGSVNPRFVFSDEVMHSWPTLKLVPNGNGLVVICLILARRKVLTGLPHNT